MNSSAKIAHLRAMDNIEDRLYRYRAKRLRFLINGDKFFSGINYALNTEKIRSFDALLNELTRSLMDHIKLCKGVRFIFNLDGGLVTALTDFQDGSTYVCSSIDTFSMTEYRINSSGMLNWLVRNSACISSSRNNVKSTNKQQQNLQSRQINNLIYSNSNNNNSNATNTATTPGSNTSKLTPKSTNINPETNNKSTSHRNNGISGKINDDINSSSNNISQLSNQLETPISNYSNSNNIINKAPNSASTASKKTPKRAAAVFNHTKLSQQQQQQHQQHQPNQDQNKQTSNTPAPKARISTANNSDSSRQRIGSLSPQPNLDTKIQDKRASTKSINTTTSTRSIFGYEVLQKYDIGKPIGDGHFSVVYCCMNKTTEQFCALKLIDKLKCRGKDDMIYNEVKILKQLNHPNIVKLIEEFDYPQQLYLILELVQDGDLFDAISAVTTFSEVHVATMIYNLSSALTYLHGQNIVHRDIKPENLLISVHEDGSQSVKLADFGLAVELGDSPLYSVCGTAFYVSPEMLNENGYDHKVDVWSTGVICFILLCGYPPFTSENEHDQDELFDAIIAGDFQFAPTYWSKISQHAKNLIKCMLTVDPKQRYTAEQVFKHPWTTGVSSNFEGINPMNISRKIALQSH